MSRAGKVVWIGTAILVAGCSSSGGTTAASSSAHASSSATSSVSSMSTICDEAAAVRASLQKLEHINASSGSISGLTTDVQNLKSSVTTLTSNAGSQWHAQTSDLKSALTGLQSAVTSLVKNPSVSAITNVKTEVGKVATAGSNLETTAKSVCD
jgi:hypothetical protein